VFLTYQPERDKSKYDQFGRVWVMLKISKKADYGMIALMHLAQHPNHGACSAREIAERYGIPLELMAKILQKLVQRGFLMSHHGTNGGYSLARSADTITAAEVIGAIEGPLSLTSCISDDGFCLQFEKCNIKSPLQRLNDNVVQLLSRTTISDMNQQQQLELKPEVLTENPFLILRNSPSEDEAALACGTQLDEVRQD
jgi:Rrf2 family protein